MRAELATPLSLVVDTWDTVTRDDARALVAAGYKARGGYLDRVTPEELDAMMSEGLRFFPIGFAKQFDGEHLAARCAALGLPPLVHCWFDDEGYQSPSGLGLSAEEFRVAKEEQAAELIDRLNTMCATMTAAGWPGAGYFGSAELLTSHEQSLLLISRYWEGCSRINDRYGVAARPDRGYCMKQGRPFNVWISGKRYDVSFVSQDYHDDLPMFCAP